MAPPTTDTTLQEIASVEDLAKHLSNEPNFPSATDLDVLAVKTWIRALDTGLSKSAIKAMAPNVLAELRGADGITSSKAEEHQKRFPVVRSAPVVTNAWERYSIPVSKAILKTVTKPNIKVEIKEDVEQDQPKKHKVKKVKKEESKEKEAKKDEHKKEKAKIDETKEVKQEEIEEDESKNKDSKQAKKKAKGAAKKEAQRLAELPGPVGGLKTTDEDADGNRSDWSEESWNPSWASGHEQ